MAAEFVGLQMVVTLHGVPPRRLKGTISDVEAGAGLTLSNVWMLDTNEWKPRLTIPSKDIADVTQVPTVPPPNAVPVAAPSNSAPPPPAPAVAQQPPRPTFVDPAIVAVGKPPSAVPPPSRAPELSSLPGLSTTTGPAPVVHPTVQVASTSREVTPTSAVAANFKGLKLRGDSATAEAAQEVEDAEAPLDFGEVVGQQKTRRVRKARNAKPPTREQDDASPAPSAKTAGRGKGWRQTPILQSTASFQPFDSLKRNGKGRHAVDSGWASEDVTDVQEMGDFDFEGGLAKFDKQNLFAQMRKDDLIDEAERLVSHNRLPRPKPGTGGGKNLHYSENLPTPAAAQGLYVLPSNRRIETVSALQMLNLENIAHNEIGLTEEMMTENAGRGIAEVTLTALADPAIKVRLAGSVDPATGASPPPPAVVVLAGNNKSGSRAVAAARHLRNKGVNVLVCVAGLERGERDLLEDVQQQVRLYRNLGGRVFTKTDFFEHLRKISIPTLTIDTPRTSSSLSAPAPPVALIVDALLGLAISFDELRNADQATVYELIEWANRNEAFVLSLDVPSGIDPSSGAVSVVDGARLYVKPRYVVAVGAPKRGLLEALVAADNDDGDKTVLAGADGAGAGAGGLGGGGGGGPLCDDAVLEWKLFLVDMGLGQAVWKKAGTRMRRGVDFGERWVLEMVYRGSLPAEEADEEEV
ncbi:uncharacterized protein THITE_2080037 [Thermothielavioides terrestris NRRL 8126]|uniref:Enhancer of mRNA-decapping protein 3 n=1 Tax=Thermothielavioides terrestris (strain ATCC 38088 / NRRL 8126) TaxID=578455 RepID=G2RBC0_THETT|nr:uncharacterized protein THITE_2080037 [Thermothielavioides terrestris NRRL 8126]AEO69091.1 hypothetical protein THITE_2080037 [Thermothielavioides terrestris NRRL 8126]